MRRDALVLLVSVAVLVLAGCLGSEDPAAPGGDDGSSSEDGGAPLPDAVSWQATGCTESAALLELDAELVRQFVPAGFTIQGEASGRVVLSLVAVLACEEFIVEGSSYGPGWVSDTGVPIDSPDGSEDPHYYHLWALTNVTPLAQGVGDLGLTGGHVANRSTDGSITEAAGIVTGSVTERIDWSEGPWTLSVDVAGAPGAPVPVPTWWHLGDRGLIRTTFEGDGLWGAQGTAVVAADGGPVQELIGGPEVRGAGLYLVFEALDVSSELVEPVHVHPANRPTASSGWAS